MQTEDPGYRLLCEEIFGPVVTAYVYPDAQWEETLDIVDKTSPYALTGAVFARDRARDSRRRASALRNAAGNFYINDKPTGAVVGQQPFGGARASGTNDKAGSKLNLVRWVERAHGEGDARAAARLQVSVHGRGMSPSSFVLRPRSLVLSPESVVLGPRSSDLGLTSTLGPRSSRLL